MGLCDRNFVILVRCALNKEILDLLSEESVSGARSGRAKSINSTRSLPRVLERVSQPLKCHSNFLGGSYTYIYIYMYINGHQP